MTLTMKKLSELIDECISPDAIEHKIKFYDYHKVKTDSYFWSNVHTLLAGYIDKESQRMHSGVDDSFGIATRRPAGTVISEQFIDSSLVNIKATFEAIAEFKDELMRGNGELTYDTKFRDTDDFTNWFLAGLKKDVFHSGEWLLQENFAEYNKWDWNIGKRIYGKLKIYRLIHNDESQMIFDLPEGTEHNLHCIIFKMSPAEQGNFFKMLKRFKHCFQILCVNMNGLQSPCLGGDMADCPIRKNKNEKDWRFIPKDLGGNNCDAYRLMLMWLRAGAIRPKLQNDNPDNLFFFHPSKVLEVKEITEKEYGENPYKHIGRSIYGAELTKKLQIDI